MAALEDDVTTFVISMLAAAVVVTGLCWFTMHLWRELRKWPKLGD